MYLQVPVGIYLPLLFDFGLPLFPFCFARPILTFSQSRGRQLKLSWKLLDYSVPIVELEVDNRAPIAKTAEEAPKPG